MSKINILIKMAKIRTIGKLFDIILKIIGLDVGRDAIIGKKLFLNIEEWGL